MGKVAHTDFERFGKRRLLKLADFLESGDMRHGKFAMRKWTTGLFGGAELGDCGTAACALGWATTIPAFRRAGLRLSDNMYHEPVFGNNDYPINSAAIFFGITDSESEDLFCPKDMGTLHGMHGRRVVAKRIRKLVEDKSRIISVAKDERFR